MVGTVFSFHFSDLKNVIKKKPNNEKLLDSLVLCLTAMAQKISGDVSSLRITSNVPTTYHRATHKNAFLLEKISKYETVILHFAFCVLPYYGIPTYSIGYLTAYPYP